MMEPSYNYISSEVALIQVRMDHVSAALGARLCARLGQSSLPRRSTLIMHECLGFLYPKLSCLERRDQLLQVTSLRY